MDALLADIGYTRWAIAALLWIPVAGAAAVLLAPAAQAKKIALAVTLLEFFVSLGLWWAYVPDGAAVQFAARHRWVPDWGIQYYVGMDGISLMLVLLTTFTMPLAVLGSWAGITTKEKGFYALMLVLTTGMIGVFVALDLFLFYVFWEVMLVPMYFLIGVWGGKGRLYASLKFFIYTMLGSLLMLVAILVLYYSAGRATGNFSFQYEHILRNATVPGSAGFWLFGAFFLAFAIKVPMVPFHTWLPDAHVEAPTAGSVILAGILLKMGCYGFLRVLLPIFPAASQYYWMYIAVLALISIIYGALVAMAQTDMKKLIAYSSVNHMGYVMLGVAVASSVSAANLVDRATALNGAMMQMFNHGVITGALFLLVGIIYERTHNRDLTQFGGLGARVPIYGGLLVTASLASLGLPGMSGFISEFFVFKGTFGASVLLTGLAVVGVVITAAFFLWMIQRVLLGPLNPKFEKITDVDAREVICLAPLVALMIALGVYPNLILRVIDTSAQTLARIFL